MTRRHPHQAHAHRQRRVTRAEARSWLTPIRHAFGQMMQGEVDAIHGYPVTRLHQGDDYARVDYCIAGFRALMSRLLPGTDTTPLERVEKRLANGVPVTHADLEACMRLFREVETQLLRFTRQQLLDAATTEQIAIELETLGLIQEAA